MPGLLLMGAVFAVSLWWGPASRRLRVPTRRLMLRGTRNAWVGWLAVALVGAAAVALRLPAGHPRRVVGPGAGSAVALRDRPGDPGPLALTGCPTFFTFQR